MPVVSKSVNEYYQGPQEPLGTPLFVPPSTHKTNLDQLHSSIDRHRITANPSDRSFSQSWQSWCNWCDWWWNWRWITDDEGTEEVVRWRWCTECDVLKVIYWMMYWHWCTEWCNDFVNCYWFTEGDTLLVIHWRWYTGIYRVRIRSRTFLMHSALVIAAVFVFLALPPHQFDPIKIESKVRIGKPPGYNSANEWCDKPWIRKSSFT